MWKDDDEEAGKRESGRGFAFGWKKGGKEGRRKEGVWRRERRGKDKGGGLCI